MEEKGNKNSTNFDKTLNKDVSCISVISLPRGLILSKLSPKV